MATLVDQASATEVVALQEGSNLSSEEVLTLSSVEVVGEPPSPGFDSL